jgi:hypothetical protein
MIGWKLTKLVARNFQRAIEARPHVLQRYGRYEFDDGLVVEVMADLVEHGIRHRDAALAHRLGQPQSGLFGIGEQRAMLEVFERGDFLEADSFLSANGRVNVNSKWTSDDLCGANGHQPLHRFVGSFGKLYRRRHRGEAPHDSRPIGLQAQGSDQLSDLLFHQRKEQPR